jgi:hypothetical protein
VGPALVTEVGPTDLAKLNHPMTDTADLLTRVTTCRKCSIHAETTPDLQIAIRNAAASRTSITSTRDALDRYHRRHQRARGRHDGPISGSV